MAISSELRVISPEEARAIHWLGSRGTFLAGEADTGGAFAAWVDEPLPKGGPVPHVHTREDELFYVVDGQVSFWCAGESFAATTGAFIGLPKGLGHQFRNDGPSPARLLLIGVPAGFERFFLELGNPIDEPSDATAPPDPKRFDAVSAKYGQILAKPTLLGTLPKPESVDLPLGVGRAPILREPGEGEAFATEGVLLTLKAVGPQTLGAYSVIEIELSGRSAFPNHRHARYTEGLYIIEGELVLDSEGRATVAKAGSIVVIPPGTSHTLANSSDQPTRLLSITVPAGVEDFYRSACRPVIDRPARPSSTPLDARRLAELGPQFGVEFP